jgi:hypothetical protein
MAKTKVADVERLESAVAHKYGKEATVDPRSEWNDEKEEDYQRQMREAATTASSSRVEKQKADGFLVVQKLVNADAERCCQICNTYSFKTKDDVYENKFGCCARCFVDFVEGREERWKDGWRPDEGRVEHSKRARRSDKTPKPSDERR